MQQSASKSRQNTILSDFYQKLTAKAKVSQLKFTSKHPFTSLQPVSQPQSTMNKEIDLTKMERSLYNTKSVLLPALRSKKKSDRDQFKQKLIINETIFIHQRVPVQNNPTTTISPNRKWSPIKKNSTPLPQVNITADIEHSKKNKVRLTKVAKSMKLVDDKVIADMSTTEFICFQQRQLSPLKHLSKNNSSGRLSKESYSYPLNQNPEEIKLASDQQTLEPIRALSPKKSNIQKMIVQYRLKKQRPEQKIPSLKCIGQDAIEELKQINIKGEQTMYISKKESPKKPYILKKERSLEQLTKMRYDSWKKRQFPFQELSKGEVNKLMAYYQGIKDVVPISSGHYRVYAGDGNNGQLIVRLLRNRGWWLPTDDINQAHLVWTQHPSELMKKTESSPSTILKQQSEIGFTIPDNQLQLNQKNILSSFLSLKNNSFFEGYAKLLHPLLYHKLAYDLMHRFKEGWSIKGYKQLKDMLVKYIKNGPSLSFQARSRVLVNHCEYSQQIGDKKHLLYHVQKYCELNQLDQHKIIPRTVHIDFHQLQTISQQVLDQKLAQFPEEQQLYILKPGECTNRGNGISVYPSKSSLINHLTNTISPSSRTFVVQEYIDPLLYQNRKFDLRVWVLLSGGKLWWYRQGYIRTSCREYSSRSMNKYVHLTNDAVQKHAEQYGKYEPGNKVSYQEMDKYLKKTYNYQDFYGEIIGKMKKLTKILFEAGSLVIGRTVQQFQLFGLDFLIDKNFQVWLIECNTNPCLETSCSLLNRLIPNMLDNMLTIAVDPHFPAPERKAIKQDIEWQQQKFNFELLSDSTLETHYIGRVKNDKQYLKMLKEINPYKLCNIQ